MTEHAWPADWADRMAGKDCPLCDALGKGDNDFSVGVFTGEVAEVRCRACGSDRPLFRPVPVHRRAGQAEY